MYNINIFCQKVNNVLATFWRQRQHAERLAPDNHFLHDDGEAVYICRLSALSA